MPDPQQYVIWSMEHQAWWRPFRMGYAPTLAEAGVYVEPEARAIVEAANYPPGTCHECMIPVEALKRLRILIREEEED